MTPIERGVLLAYANHYEAPWEQVMANAERILMNYRQLMVAMTDQLPAADPEKREIAARAWALCEMDVRG